MHILSFLWTILLPHSERAEETKPSRIVTSYKGYSLHFSMTFKSLSPLKPFSIFLPLALWGSGKSWNGHSRTSSTFPGHPAHLLTILDTLRRSKPFNQVKWGVRCRHYRIHRPQTQSRSCFFLHSPWFCNANYPEVLLLGFLRCHIFK